MSNNNLTIEYIADVVYNLNCEFNAKLYSISPQEDYMNIFTLTSDGEFCNVDCLGQHVFSLVDDDRKYIEDDEFETIIDNDGNESLEDLKLYLHKEYNKIRGLLVDF